MDSKTYSRIAFWAIGIVCVLALVITFYTSFAARYPEDGWVKTSKGNVHAVVGGRYHYLPNKVEDYYPRYNFRDLDFSSVADNRRVMSGKISIQYTFIPQNIILSRKGYEELIELWVYEAGLEAANLTNESDIALTFSNHLHKLSKGMGVQIIGTLISSVEFTDPIVKINEEKRARRRAAQTSFLENANPKLP